jgi:hypothetical protein
MHIDRSVALAQAWVGPDRCCDELLGRLHGGNQVFALGKSRRDRG